MPILTSWAQNNGTGLFYKFLPCSVEAESQWKRNEWIRNSQKRVDSPSTLRLRQNSPHQDLLPPLCHGLFLLSLIIDEFYLLYKGCGSKHVYINGFFPLYVWRFVTCTVEEDWTLISGKVLKLLTTLALVTFFFLFLIDGVSLIFISDIIQFLCYVV